MKAKILLLSLLAASALVSVPVMRAADDSTPPPPAEGRGGLGRMNAAEQLKRLTEELSLTPDQQSKIKPILEDRDQKAKALFTDKSLSQDDRRNKIRELAKATHQLIRPLLTSDQQTKYDAMRPGPGGGGRGKKSE